MISNLGAYLALGSTKLITFADENTIGGAVRSLLLDGENSVYGTIKIIALPLCVVVGACGGIAWAFSPSGKGAEKGKMFFTAAILGLVAVYLAYPAILQVLNIVETYGKVG